MVQTHADEQTIFEVARKIDSLDSRQAYLQQMCGDNAELQLRVDALLKAHAEAGSFLEQPAIAGDATILHEPPITERPGTVIGPYKLLQQIGEGGMGVVFMAEQSEPIQRTVALKIIKPGMDTRQIIARFDAERQALALMDHPNIARVLDAGETDTGRSYFVMEIVRGVPITQFCDEHQLSIAERLELVVQVCQAVQHAHQKGIIHRDLKPSNVLVAEYDDHPVPKVIDFGIAKATAQKLTERTMFTEFGQVLGTLDYMSPEQAKLNQLDVDTRSDIYSLGVLLYELLVGSTPFEQQRLREAAFDEVLRIIREEDPPMPSKRLGTSETLPVIAAKRRTEPAKLNRELRGELDWIVMKALDKIRDRRYETAASLAADIEHYRADEPVSAGPPSRVYRFMKFVRRNRRATVASAAILLGLIAGVIGLSIGLVSQSQQRAAAERERAEAQLNLAAALQQQDRNGEAEALYRQALATTSGDTAEDRQRAARTLLRLAQVVGQRGDAAESEKLYRKALVAHRAAFAPGDANIAHALSNLGLLLRQQPRLTEVEPLFREAYEINRQATPSDHRVIGASSLYLGHTIFLQGRHAEAEPLLREALAEYQLAVPPDERSVALTQVELGRDLDALGRRLEAEVQLLDAARVLESTAEFGYPASALAAFYTAWDESEPGKGHDLQAREWFRKLIKGFIYPGAKASEP
jgi:eukaryotic-like serine/threonine-protein kinase